MPQSQSAAVKGFSRFAHVYDQYNMIQAKVAEALVEELEDRHFDTVIDIGCGSGAIYKNLQKRSISFEHFVASDLSSQMLDLHPSSEKVTKIRSDLNDGKGLEQFCDENKVMMLSSSALQWSSDLDRTFSWVSKCSKESRFAIFTSATFQTLHQTAGISSPIYSRETLQETIDKYYDATFRVERYALEFPDTKAMFRYIQKSGVGGGERQLSYTQMKKVMAEYPLDYLEFEVLFVRATSR